MLLIIWKLYCNDMQALLLVFVGTITFRAFCLLAYSYLLNSCNPDIRVTHIIYLFSKDVDSSDIFFSKTAHPVNNCTLAPASGCMFCLLDYVDNLQCRWCVLRTNVRMGTSCQNSLSITSLHSTTTTTKNTAVEHSHKNGDRREWHRHSWYHGNDLFP